MAAASAIMLNALASCVPASLSAWVLYAMGLALVCRRFGPSATSVALAVLDVASTGFALWGRATRWLSAVFTVYCDPLGVSLRPISHGVVVSPIPALSERERRVVAWLYRWHPSPVLADWLDCTRRFGLDRIPSHCLVVSGGQVASDAVYVELLCELYVCGLPVGSPTIRQLTWVPLPRHADASMQRVVGGIPLFNALSPAALLKAARGATAQCTSLDAAAVRRAVFYAAK